MFTEPKWKAALYIDEKAKPEKREVFVNILSGKEGGFFEIAAKLLWSYWVSAMYQ